MFVAIRPAWGENRVFLFDEDGVQRSLPARWTDAVAPDAFAALSGGRSAFRVADLLALGALLDGLRGSVGGRGL